MEIRPLAKADDRSTFRSGDPDLDAFFEKYAGQNQFKHHIGATYVAIEEGRICGYVTVAPADIESDDLPAATRRRLPAYPLPVLRIGRLATDIATRGQGVGKALLRYAFTLAREMRDRYGCVGVLVDAKPGAVDFYAKYGFVALDVVEGQSDARPQPTVMFLPLAEIETARP
jgi:predicted GNAT family N-acyltransferase